VIDQIWVPDAFTPNGDGLNDVLELPGVSAFPEAVITIFNRWGEVVFKSEKGYPKPFDGTLNGNKLPTGIYLYQLQTTISQPPTEGSIMLLRN
jgi:gliding motility-associated-like protein